jgi:D-beta-D-heptose 7-phosphate kinase / D-beta-D-heptose 1-phosphate adenosyltransferase
VSRPVRLAVVGDALLDRDLLGEASRISPDAPVPVLEERSETVRPGGAGLAALLAARDGAQVTLITALAADGAGATLRDGLAGVELHAATLAGSTPMKTRIRAAGQSLLRLDRGGPAGAVGPVPAAGLAAIRAADAVLVADYGRGLTSVPAVRDALAAAARRTPVVWDPHPRGAAPVPGCRLVTPNLAEASGFADRPVDTRRLGDVGQLARELAARWRAGAVAITLGGRGALLWNGSGPPLAVPAPPVSTVDTCGAGDRFAAAAALLLGAGRLPSEAVAGAVDAAAAFVAAGAAAGLAGAGAGLTAGTGDGDQPRADAGHDGVAVAARVRAAGGTVVATGGCFDLLHAGHVSLLAAARRLGDCLVVCLNSDDSVRRLKGPDRPVVGAQDRARVLRALECVDATVLFDEDDPAQALRRVRPHLWVKGGDYAGRPLPEAGVLAEWDGAAVLLPYVAGRSTTGLIDEVRIGGSARPERS